MSQNHTCFFFYKHDGYKHDEAHFGQILSMKLSMNPGSLFLGKHLSMNKAQNNTIIYDFIHILHAILKKIPPAAGIPGSQL